MEALALGCYVAYLAVVIGVRMLIQRRWTGSTGVKFMEGRIWSREWIASVLFGNGMLANGYGPVLALLGVVTPFAALDTTAVHVAGFALFAIGFATTFAVQLAMGKSWRIGVHDSSDAPLVTDGPFGVVRNPICAAILLTSSGVALMAPTVVALIALILLLAGIELMVRTIEEPYLRRAYGADYDAYARRVGRFVPGVGRLRSGERQPA